MSEHRNVIVPFLFAMVLVSGVLATGAPAADLYVSPGGNDAWNGQRASIPPSGDAGPFATLERARDAIRAIKKTGELPEGGVTVHVAEGTYFLREPFTLTDEDSGTTDAPITYLAEKTGSARLMAGHIITGFKPVTDEATLKRLDEAARSKVYEIALKSQGITDYGPVEGGGLELFFNGKPMQIARWPNEGFTRIVDLRGGEEFDIRGTNRALIGRWVYKGDRPSRWIHEKDAWLNGYWSCDWSSEYQRVKSIDPGEHIIEVEKPYHVYGYRKGQWYYALNLLCEIDTPGEWYLDRENGILYFWPPSPPENAEAFVSLLPEAVKMNNVSNCTLRGFVVEGVRNTDIIIEGGEHDRIEACIIRNSGGTAVRVDDGTDIGVIGCDIYDVGGGGMVLKGGDRKTLTPAKLFADNNHIHDYARWYRMLNPGISLKGVGNRASHNLIDNAPHIAIIFGGNDHIIEYNEIHSVCYESSDAGAIYAGRDWTQRGTVIRYNFMHDVTGFEGRGSVGVYLDDMFCGTHIYGNLFYRVYRAAFIGGGRDNVYENNLFVDCPKALHIDNRAQNWAGPSVDKTMTERLIAMPYTNALWKKKYPNLSDILQDDPAAPKGNLIARNIFYGPDWKDYPKEIIKYITFKNNMDNQNPNLTTPDKARDNPSPKATDFALKKDSPAFALGFKPLPLDMMGLYEDADRASWPTVDSVRPEGKPDPNWNHMSDLDTLIQLFSVKSLHSV
ncbi:peptidase [Desulforhabdus sp. TSK]|nr:peptidase [Desulforhabdus sp. TSK]